MYSTVFMLIVIFLTRSSPCDLNELFAGDDAILLCMQFGTVSSFQFRGFLPCLLVSWLILELLRSNLLSTMVVDRYLKSMTMPTLHAQSNVCSDLAQVTTSEGS